jgi:hypothetical protein
MTISKDEINEKIAWQQQVGDKTEVVVNELQFELWLQL